jgi:hypothetical protein
MTAWRPGRPQAAALREAHHAVQVVTIDEPVPVQGEAAVAAVGLAIALAGPSPGYRPGVGLGQALQRDQRHADQRRRVDAAPVLALDHVERLEAEADAPGHHLFADRPAWSGVIWPS